MRLLIAAAGARADVFVSSDKAVLKRESSGAMRIVAPGDGSFRSVPGLRRKRVYLQAGPENAAPDVKRQLRR